jgi:NitT/TauT family transport system substrate-binding protein
VDGAVTFDPYRAQLLRAGASTVFDSTRIPGEIVDVVAVRESALRTQPKAIRALLAGWFDATDYMQRDPTDAARRMGIRQQATGEQFLASLSGLHIPSREENLKLIGGPGPQLAGSARQLMALMLDAKLLRSAVDVNGLFAPAPLENLP